MQALISAAIDLAKRQRTTRKRDYRGQLKVAVQELDRYATLFKQRKQLSKVHHAWIAAIDNPQLWGIILGVDNAAELDAKRDERRASAADRKAQREN